MPLRQTREDLGYTQTQIDKMEEADDAQATRDAQVGVKAIRDAAMPTGDLSQAMRDAAAGGN